MRGHPGEIPLPGLAAEGIVSSKHGLTLVNSAGAAGLEVCCKFSTGRNEKSPFAAAVYIS